VPRAPYRRDPGSWTPYRGDPGTQSTLYKGLRCLEHPIERTQALRAPLRRALGDQVYPI